MTFDAPTISALAGAIVAILGGVAAIVRLIIGAVQKRRAGVASSIRQRDRDMVQEIVDLKREVSHLERQSDTNKRNWNRVMDRWVEARRKTIELYGRERADIIFGETPEIDQTLSYDEIRRLNTAEVPLQRRRDRE